MPEETVAGEQTLEERVKSVLDEIRPFLQRDGGDVEFIELTEDNIVRVKLQGACAGCPMAQITLTRGVEARIKEDIPEIEAVENVRD